MNGAQSVDQDPMEDPCRCILTGRNESGGRLHHIGAFVPAQLLMDAIFIQFIQRIPMNGRWKCDQGGVPDVAYFIAAMNRIAWGFFKRSFFIFKKFIYFEVLPPLIV